MPVCIVHGLEAVQVDKHDGSHAFAACRACLIRPLGEGASVRQAGQRVVERLMPQPIEQRRSLRHIAEAARDCLDLRRTLREQVSRSPENACFTASAPLAGQARMGHPGSVVRDRRASRSVRSRGNVPRTAQRCRAG